MNRFEQKQAEKAEMEKRSQEYFAKLDEWTEKYADKSIKWHESRTKFCAIDCMGCNMRELQDAMEKLMEYED